MSDERDTVGPDADKGADDTTRAAPTGSGAARPSGKRAVRGRRGRRAESVEATVDVTSDADVAASAAEASAKPGYNPFVFLFRFIREVVAEIRKVIWPTRPQMLTYTIVVLVFLVFMTALVSGVDLGAGKLVELVFGRTPTN